MKSGVWKTLGSPYEFCQSIIIRSQTDYPFRFSIHHVYRLCVPAVFLRNGRIILVQDRIATFEYDWKFQESNESNSSLNSVPVASRIPAIAFLNSWNVS